MIKEIFEKLSTFANHHQYIFSLIIGFSLICISWGIERLLEEYVFTKKSLHTYTLAIAIGLLLLWVTQHFILHAI